VPVERINHYKKSFNLRFSNEETEASFKKFQRNRGRSTSIYALSALAVLNLVFAFLEHWILGINSVIPMIAYLVVAGIAIAGVIFSILSRSTIGLSVRILLPGLLTLGILLYAVYLDQYRIYHAVEISLLVIWLASLNILSLRLAALFSFGAYALFTTAVYLFETSELKLIGLLAIELSSFSLAIYLSYLFERFRRMLFLTDLSLNDAYSRQESWAFTLIDLDMALSGIRNFKELTNRLMEHIKSVIDYDSFILTSLEGKGPKPEPDNMEGTLFEQEDVTLWPDDLMTKLSQTRQAVASSQFDMVKGFLGRKKQHFLHFRLDIPLFNDSTLVGVISLRRRSPAFDELDLTASVSLTSQAMMIYKMSLKSTQMSETLLKHVAGQAAKAPVKVEKPRPAPRPTIVTEAEPRVPKESSNSSTNLDLTEDSDTAPGDDVTPDVTPAPRSQGRDETVVPQAVIDKIRKDTETHRKTITLLSRENADQIAVDRYRTAAVEGEPLSVLLIEIDGLSALREKDGDQVAYKVFAGIVKNIFAKTEKDRDVLGRYGQNGLSVLLPKVDMNAAEKFAESIRKFTESIIFKTAYGERKATLSIGVAAITDETGNYDSMVKRADMALFVAKKNGRNCVKVRL
jgi:diguanylate cyclase (GGDEF)-like protein